MCFYFPKQSITTANPFVCLLFPFILNTAIDAEKLLSKTTLYTISVLSIMLIAHPPSWQDIAAAKREALIATIPPEWLIPASLLPTPEVLDVTEFPSKSGFFTAHELEITASTSTELLDKLHTGTWTAVDVTKAFCKRSAVAHQLVRLDISFDMKISGYS